MTPHQRIVLVGFMGAGKSTVARLLGERLGWNHVDVDREIERHAGISIREIFDRSGEAEFRRLEREITRGLVGCVDTVIASGGGWMVQPGLADELGAHTLLVWLRVSAPAVLERLGNGRLGRPLLSGVESASQVADLLAARATSYARANLAVHTDDHTAEQVADAVERAVRPHIS